MVYCASQLMLSKVREVKTKRKTFAVRLLIAIKDSAAKTLYYGDELLIPAKV